MKKLLSVLLFVSAGFATASAQETHHKGHAHDAPACGDPLPSCAVTATPSFAPDGRLWLAYAVGGIVYAASSNDLGKTFDKPVAVNHDALDLDDNGEARPQLLRVTKDTLIVTFGVRTAEAYSGSLMVSRSVDGGHSFLPPARLVDDANQRFQTIGAAPDGRIYIAWLDKRNLKFAQARNEPYSGSGFALAWSDDQGATFSGKDILVDHSCECCRIAMNFDRDGAPVFAWRQMFGKNVRDHMAAKFAAGRLVQQIRVSDDDWAVEACPHHGPSLAIDADGTWHVAWYTAGNKRKGLFYAYHTRDDTGFSPPQPFGNPDNAPSHPQVLAMRDGRLFRAWKEFDGTKTSILVQMSRDHGQSWTVANEAAMTKNGSDHPLLVSDGKTAYLSWLTREEGYRLIPLAEGGE